MDERNIKDSYALEFAHSWSVYIDLVNLSSCVSFLSLSLSVWLNYSATNVPRTSLNVNSPQHISTRASSQLCFQFTDNGQFKEDTNNDHSEKPYSPKTLRIDCRILFSINHALRSIFAHKEMLWFLYELSTKLELSRLIYVSSIVGKIPNRNSLVDMWYPVKKLLVV